MIEPNPKYIVSAQFKRSGDIIDFFLQTDQPSPSRTLLSTRFMWEPYQDSATRFPDKETAVKWLTFVFGKTKCLTVKISEIAWEPAEVVEEVTK